MNYFTTEHVNRIEIWFNNGLFRAYPDVDQETINGDDSYLTFKFSGNIALIELHNVNFIEFMYDEK